ncbi:MAG: hypothetical protein IKM55_04530 [Bacilli bacterium]|nr:hypothetical protein [Bacilli bacterium]
MEKGMSNLTKYLFRYLEPGKEEEMDIYISDVLDRDYLTLESDEQVSEVFGEIAAEFTSNLSYQEALSLRSYTGFSHKEINALLRDKWNYEQHGKLTDERRNEYTEIGQEVEKVVFKFPPLERNIKTYRGVTLAQFRDYGIYSLEDLKAMEGKYFYDGGFTSTSLVRKSSLYNTEAFQIGKRNIEIEYLIPEECRDGALLLDEYTSHYKAENEYIINSGSLIRILSVDIDKENNTAFLRAILVPKKVWDPRAVRHLEEESKKTK